MIRFSRVNLFSDNSFIHKKLKEEIPEEDDRSSTGKCAQRLRTAAILGRMKAKQENYR